MSNLIIKPESNVLDIWKNYSNRLSDALLSTLHANVSVIDSIVNTIHACLSANQKVLFMGVGKNAYLSQKLAATFQSLNFQASFFDANHALHGDLGFLRNGDVIFAFSKSGKTSELLQTIKYIKSLPKFNNVIVVSMFASYVDSELTEIKTLSDFYLTMPNLEEADDAKTVPTVSALVMQFVGDAIALRLTALTKLTTEQFKLTHPGGNIGQTL